jgi:hypothetical protein
VCVCVCVCVCVWVCGEIDQINSELYILINKKKVINNN